MQEKRIPRTTQVFLDSPMAISATEIFERHPECYDAETFLVHGDEDAMKIFSRHLKDTQVRMPEMHQEFKL